MALIATSLEPPAIIVEVRRRYRRAYRIKLKRREVKDDPLVSSDDALVIIPTVTIEPKQPVVIYVETYVNPNTFAERWHVFKSDKVQNDNTNE